MSLTTEFIPLELDHLRREAAVMKADGWRFVQTHAVYTDDGVDLYYSFMKDGLVRNYWIQGVQKGTAVPSITDLFLAAFVFENEARELFGVNMRDIAIDFAGAMYAPAVDEPMTIISPEQKAAREKARKAAAKAAKGDESGESGKGARGTTTASKAPDGQTAKRVFVMTPELQARLDAKLPTLSEEKRAKVEAALKARAAEAEAAAQGSQAESAAEGEEAPALSGQPATEASADESSKQIGGGNTPSSPVDAVLEATISALDADKAARVRAALAGTAGASSHPQTATATEGEAEPLADGQLAALIGNMDDAKAAIVRAALTAKGGE